MHVARTELCEEERDKVWRRVVQRGVERVNALRHLCQRAHVLRRHVRLVQREQPHKLEGLGHCGKRGGGAGRDPGEDMG